MILRARWVLPIASAPVAGGWVEVDPDTDRITAWGGGAPPGQARDLGDVALLPGLVNAHTHLELSWMAGSVPPASSMSGWIRALMHGRRSGPPGGEDEIVEAMARAAVAMHAAGTVLVGDISNSLLSPRVLAQAGLGGIVFHELVGFNPGDPARIVRDAWQRVTEVEQSLDRGGRPLALTVVAHAPYSVAPSLFAEILRRPQPGPLSIHLAESAEEVELLRTGTGPMRDMLVEFGAWPDAWVAPACDPVRYLSDLGYLQSGALIVHGVHLTDDALDRLRTAGAVLVTCPRSNHWVGSGSPRLAHFYASRVPVAIGTDSLASAPTLSLFDELAEMRRIAPEVAASALLDSATRRGAEALGLGHEYGTIAPGKRAALVAVDVPAGAIGTDDVEDVEEYLVSGVTPAAVRRVA
jgi:cytosine/adenosine deaminase-related metal-dependent hydrolase